VLHTEVMGDVRLLTIDRPERRNALDHATLDALAEALAPEDTRVVVLTGAAGHFCAGADLTGVEDPAFVGRLQDVLERLVAAPFVTLAAIDGAALGAGTQLAVACDLRVATPSASFGVPAAKLGLAVDSWTVERVARLAGQSTAQAMLLAAEVVDGVAAHRTGLVQRLGTLDDALAWAKEITALAPLTIQAHKTALRGADADAKVARDRAWASEDLQEGLAAFRDRRPPVFQGR
jgi:enoyl-CoA hydratase